jgi:hypothetical protein
MTTTLTAPEPAAGNVKTRVSSDGTEAVFIPKLVVVGDEVIWIASGEERRITEIEGEVTWAPVCERRLITRLVAHIANTRRRRMSPPPTIISKDRNRLMDPLFFPGGKKLKGKPF